MKNEVLEKSYSLKEAMEQSEIFKRLQQSEQQMEQNEEVMLLGFAFSNAQTDYNDILKHFASESPEAKTVQKKLYETKKKLDEHPLVREYLHNFQEVRKIYDSIQENIFTPFTGHGCNEKK